MTYKAVSAKRLLLADRFSLVSNSGVDWVVSPYGFARASIVAGNPKPTLGSMTVTSFRSILERTRAGVRPGTVTSTQVLAGDHLLIRTGLLHTAINPVAWKAWTRTGLTPRVNNDGTVLWYGKVRGKEALFGAIQPVYVGKVS